MPSRVRRLSTLGPAQGRLLDLSLQTTGGRGADGKVYVHLSRFEKAGFNVREESLRQGGTRSTTLPPAATVHRPAS